MAPRAHFFCHFLRRVYRTSILFLHGRMGKGKRAVVPSCIGGLPFDPIPLKSRSYHFHNYTFSSLVAKIREMFPEADGNYIGFKRKGAEEKMS